MDVLASPGAAGLSDAFDIGAALDHGASGLHAAPAANRAAAQSFPTEASEATADAPSPTPSVVQTAAQHMPADLKYAPSPVPRDARMGRFDATA